MRPDIAIAVLMLSTVAVLLLFIVFTLIASDEIAPPALCWLDPAPAAARVAARLAAAELLAARVTIEYAESLAARVHASLLAGVR